MCARVDALRADFNRYTQGEGLGPYYAARLTGLVTPIFSAVGAVFKAVFEIARSAGELATNAIGLVAGSTVYNFLTEKEKQLGDFLAEKLSCSQAKKSPCSLRERAASE